MTAFMSYDINVTFCAVKVCKDKRRIVVGQVGHIAARSFGLSAENIEKLVLHHEVKEFLGFGRKLCVHLLSVLQNIFGSADGLGISFLKINTFVNVGKLFQTQSLSSSVMQLFCKRHEILLNLIAEVLHLILAVAVALHTVVA